MNDKDMGVIAKSENELKLYYHPDSRIAQQCIAVAETINAKKFLINLEEVKLTETQWGEIARLLDKDPIDLINTDHPFVKENLSEDPDVNPNEILKVLVNNPEVLKNPIAMKGSDVIEITGINDLMKFQETDSKDAKLP